MSAHLLSESSYDYSWLMDCPDLVNGEVPQQPVIIQADDWVTFDSVDHLETIS